jgi:hypothetical protein
MAEYELVGNLEALLNVLKMMDHLIEDENGFNTDQTAFIKEFNDLAKSSDALLREAVKIDPDVPLSHENFLVAVNSFRGKGGISYRELETFGIEELVPFIKEVEDLLEETADKPQETIVGNLAIPLMSWVNHQPHPTRPGYMVYHYKDAEHARYFQELMEERALFYERFDENRDGEEVYWFGVRDQDQDAVEIINYTVKGKFRKPLIRDKGARYVILGLGLIMVLLAIVGAIMSNS